uniref:DNA damage-inducible transcript 4 protein n=1 Tax=Tetraodon nigroviridis TaxID=99883 RepID=H3CTA1_TETNG
AEMSPSCNRPVDGSLPPSPAEQRRSQRLSWGSLLQKLGELKGNNQRAAAGRLSSSSSQTVALFASGCVADMSLLELENSFLCYPLEETLAAEVAQHISLSLQEASSSLGCSRLLFPDLLLHSISQELLHLASNEPCGLRGALVDLWCGRGGHNTASLFPTQIPVEPTLGPLHLPGPTLVLRLDASGLWPKVRKLFKGSASPRVPTKHGSSRRLSTSFRAIKRKLYSSGELLIEEC